MGSRPLAVVTGGAGFLGSHMVDLLLAEGYRVHLIDNLTGGRLQNLDDHKENKNLVVEVRDIREVEASDPLFKGAQYVFHFVFKIIKMIIKKTSAND